MPCHAMRYTCSVQPQNRELEPFIRKTTLRVFVPLSNLHISFIFIFIFIFIVPVLILSSRSPSLPSFHRIAFSACSLHKFQLQAILATYLGTYPTCTSDVLHVREYHPPTCILSHTHIKSYHIISDPSRFHNRYAYLP